MSRFVIIDDTNPSIQYSGPWLEVNNTQLMTGYNGPPFNNSLHGVNTTASLSFPFSGSAVIAYGTSVATTTPAGNQDPSWECFIDNTSIGSSRPSGTRLNNWILCGVGPDKIQDGPHLLTVNATVSNQTFWFDQIQYVPSANVSLNQLYMRIDSSDSAIQYSPGSWQSQDSATPINYTTTALFGNYSYTQINGAFLTYNFSGTSISMFSSASNSSSFGVPMTNATYTIDDQEPINFSLGPSFNQMSFETGQLSPEQHKLVVIYLGNNDTAPMIVSYFVVQVHQDVPLASTSPGNPTKAIIGGVIGGVVFISLLIALFVFIRRRRSNTVPYPENVTLSTVPVRNPTTTLPGLGPAPGPPET